MSEMKEMLMETVERIYKNNVSKEVVDIIEVGDLAEDVWGILIENEILNVVVSEKHGGASGDIEDLLGLCYLIGKYAVPVPFFETIFANFVLELGQLQPAQQKVTYSLQQEGLRFTTEGTVEGTLNHVAWARHVDELVVVMQGKIVQLSLQDASVTNGMNLAGEPRDTVTFNGTKVKQQATISTEHLKQLQAIQTAAKNAQVAGAIDKVFDLTVRYAKEREQFGRPIHRFQLVQQHIAHLAGEQAIASAAFENMVAALLQGRYQDEIAYTTIRLDDAIKVATAAAHQVHAAIGVTHEHSLHQYTRRLWAWREEGLTASYWKNIMAQAILTSNEDNIWTYLTNRERAHQPN